jgi:hypothetical protein
MVIRGMALFYAAPPGVSCAGCLNEAAMNRIVAVALLVAGIIHLLPLPGVLGGAQLERLYGMPFAQPDLLILMRHRAVLFGLLGALLVAAAFRPTLQPLAIAAGLASACAFLVLAWTTGGYGAPLARVVGADVVAIGCLLLAAALRGRTGR